jgi:adenosylhomocysteinase
MKDGAALCNSGHFDIEIELPALAEEAGAGKTRVREHVDEYKLKNGRRLYVIGEGRLVNLAAAHGHPASVMDMSFATQALTSEYCFKNKGKLASKVLPVPVEVEDHVARTKLASMAIEIDTLTAEQKKYMTGWEQGT